MSSYCSMVRSSVVVLICVGLCTFANDTAHCDTVTTATDNQRSVAFETTAPTTLSPVTTASEELTSQGIWRAQLSKAMAADDYRELIAGEPGIFRECEEPVGPMPPRRSRTRRETRFIPSTRYQRSHRGTAQRKPDRQARFLHGGHGWTYDLATGIWYTQRPLLFGMVEDFGNLDQLNFFADFCFRAGATVVPIRPLGFQPLTHRRQHP